MKERKTSMTTRGDSASDGFARPSEQCHTGPPCMVYLETHIECSCSIKTSHAHQNSSLNKVRAFEIQTGGKRRQQRRGSVVRGSVVHIQWRPSLFPLSLPYMYLSLSLPTRLLSRQLCMFSPIRVTHACFVFRCPLAVVMPAWLRPGTAGSPGSWPAATTGRLSPTPTGRSSRRSTTPRARARARARTRLVRPGGGWREQTSACPPSPEQPCLCSERVASRPLCFVDQCTPDTIDHSLSTMCAMSGAQRMRC